MILETLGLVPTGVGWRVDSAVGSREDACEGKRGVSLPDDGE